MRIHRVLALTAVLAMAGTACADLEVTNLNDPDRERAISTPEDVENLIAGGFSQMWRTWYQGYPTCAFDVGADNHSSSWGNWGMRDFSWEPRKEYDNDPAYGYNNVTETPWTRAYRALSGVRDGVAAIKDGGLKIYEGETDVTNRALAFGYLIQALALSNLALTFDQAYVVDEDTDLDALSDPQPYTAIWAAAQAKFDAARGAASGNWTLPAAWTGNGTGEWTPQYLIQFANAFEMRTAMRMGRTPAERDAAPWGEILSTAKALLDADFEYGIDDQNALGWDWSYHHGRYCWGGTIGGATWGVVDNRTFGPSDASGAFANYLATPIETRDGRFYIDTDDERIAAPGSAGMEDGLYTFVNDNGGAFRPDRGLYHFSHYHDTRMDWYWQQGSVGYLPDFTENELLMMQAEAEFRVGSKDIARQIVNDFRARGNLPELTGTGTVPGGDRCVPKPDGVNCGDLWEALKYESRIETYQMGYGAQYFDDRGWGDLVTDTPVHIPIPGSELLLLLMDIYSFGGPDDGTAAPNLLDDFSPEGLNMKRQALERFDEFMADNEFVTVKH